MKNNLVSIKGDGSVCLASAYLKWCVKTLDSCCTGIEHGGRHLQPTCLEVAGRPGDRRPSSPKSSSRPDTHREKLKENPSARQFTHRNPTSSEEAPSSEGEVTDQSGYVLSYSVQSAGFVCSVDLLPLLIIATAAVTSLATAPAATLEDLAEATKKAGLNISAAAFMPSKPRPQAQTSNYAAAAHLAIKISPAAEPGIAPAVMEVVAQPRLGPGAADEPTGDVAAMKIKLRPEAPEYLPVAKSSSPRIDGSKSCPQAQTSNDVAATHLAIEKSPAAEPGIALDAMEVVAETKLASGAADEPTSDAVVMRINLRPEAAVHLPIANSGTPRIFAAKVSLLASLGNLRVCKKARGSRSSAARCRLCVVGVPMSRSSVKQQVMTHASGLPTSTYYCGLSIVAIAVGCNVTGHDQRCCSGKCTTMFSVHSV